jgi:hypothetical protein
VSCHFWHEAPGHGRRIASEIPVLHVRQDELCPVGLQAGGYYLGMLAYYWVLATPVMGFLFGCYLYISVNWFHVHYDEAFSSLRISHYKGFSRLHVNRKARSNCANALARKALALGSPARSLSCANIVSHAEIAQVFLHVRCVCLSV